MTAPSPFQPTNYTASIMAAVASLRGGVAFTTDPPTNVLAGTGVVVAPGGINLGLNHDNQIGIFNGIAYEWTDPILYWPIFLANSDGLGTPGFLYYNGANWITAVPIPSADIQFGLMKVDTMESLNAPQNRAVFYPRILTIMGVLTVSGVLAELE